MKIRPVLVIHGGAGDKDLSGSARDIHENAVRAVLDSVYPKLERGMSASEAAAWACALLEDNPLYNAGYGSKIQSDGKIRMSASLMDGHRRRFAGCVNVESVKNPIYLARALMDEKDRVLSGIGAKRFARECGLKFASQYTPEQRISWHQQKEGKAGTVGVIVLDVKGRLAAATSTGGRGFEYPYRVSDSPTSAGTICAYVETGMPLKKAVAKVIAKARKRGAEFGMIALDRKGNFTAATTTKCIVWAGTDGKSTKTF
jgi:L-asparaginase